MTYGEAWVGESVRRALRARRTDSPRIPHGQEEPSILKSLSTQEISSTMFYIGHIYLFVIHFRLKSFW